MKEEVGQVKEEEGEMKKEDELVKTSIKPSSVAPRNRPIPFPASSKRSRANDEEDEGGAAKRSHLDEDCMEEKEMSDLLNTSHDEGENCSDIADEDITKLLDDEKDISSSMVQTVLDEVLEKVLGNESGPMSPIFALSGKSRPFVRNTPSSMRRHGSHRRLHDSGLAESEGELEEDDSADVIEEMDVFISNLDQVKDQFELISFLA